MVHATTNPRNNPATGIGAGDVRLLALLLAVTALVLGKDMSVGGFRDGDSAVHAMDGVLIHDWIAAGPKSWRDPMAFADQQYAHYPSLGLGRHYPPGFALFEAAFFGAFGISIWTARLCVVFFGLVAAAGTYAFMRQIADRAAAGLAVVALITMPATVLWGRQTMLEVPTLAALAWAAAAFVWYLRAPNWRRFAVLAAAMIFALFFKQTAVFLPGAVGFTLAYGAVRGVVRRSHGWGAVVIAVALVGLVAFSLGGHAAKLLHGDVTYPSFWSWNVLTGYLVIIPRQVGLPAFAVALLGAWIVARKGGLLQILLVSWVFVCYAMLTVADFKFDRYLFVGLFPFAVWAAVGARWLVGLLPSGWSQTAPMLAATTWCVASAVAVSPEQRPDYGPVVLAHEAALRDRAVLFSGLRDGDFVFAVRQHIPWRRATVIRGSKLLYTCNGRPDLDFAPHAFSPHDVVELMRRFAFQHVFVERENKLGVAQDDWLRSYLSDSGDYKLVAKYPLLMGGQPSRRDVTLDVYQAARPLVRTVEQFDLPIPRAGRTVRVDLGSGPP